MATWSLRLLGVGNASAVELGSAMATIERDGAPWLTIDCGGEGLTAYEAAYGDTPGWGESDVDEAVELLERAYRDREDARRRGARGAATLSRHPWSRTASEVKAAVLETCAAQGV